MVRNGAVTDRQLADAKGRRKSFLLLSLVLLFTGLFALVSRWPIAYYLIGGVCVFYLVTDIVTRRRYVALCTRAILERSAEKELRDVSYSAAENGDGLPVRTGLTPELSYASGARLHHVLNGDMDGTKVSLMETAFVRTEGKHITGTLA